jgi:hypothetical protein
MPLLDSNRKKFREVVFTALGTAFKNGQVSRMQVFTIRLATFFRPKILDDMFDACCEQMAEEGIPVMGADGAINWDAIAKFWVTVLPVLLDVLLKLISVL